VKKRSMREPGWKKDVNQVCDEEGEVEADAMEAGEVTRWVGIGQYYESRGRARR
jgi:hypothetical protein